MKTADKQHPTTGKQQLIGRRTFVTHRWAHADEIGAITAFKRSAAALGFKDIETFGFAFVDAGSPVPSYLVGRDWKKEEIIAFGVWGEAWGPFDEHDHPESGDSCSSRVLRYLKEHAPGFDDPRAEALVAYITRIDRRPGAGRDSIPDAIKAMNSAWKDMVHAERDKNELRTIEWASVGFNAYLDHGDPKEKQFKPETIAALINDEQERKKWQTQCYLATNWKQEHFTKALQWLEKKQQQGGLEHIYSVPHSHGKDGKITIIAVENDNPSMHNALFYQGADVVIVKKSDGHVAILSSSKRCIKLYDLACILNREELKLRGKEGYRQLTKRQLCENGTIEENVWCFNEKHTNQSLLNGSSSAPDVDPTRIKFDRIVEMAVLALDESRFSTRKDGHACDGKTCTSSRKTPCRFYWHYFHRCHELQINGVKQRHEKPADTKGHPSHKPDQKAMAKVIPIKAKATKPVPAPKPTAEVRNPVLADKLAALRRNMKY